MAQTRTALQDRLRYQVESRKGSSAKTQSWGKLPSRYSALERALLPRLTFEVALADSDCVLRRYNAAALGFQKTSNDEFQSSKLNLGQSEAGNFNSNFCVAIQNAGAMAPRWEDSEWSVTVLIDLGNGWKVIGRLAYPANPRLDLTRFQGKSVHLDTSCTSGAMTMTGGGSDNPEKEGDPFADSKVILMPVCLSPMWPLT